MASKITGMDESSWQVSLLPFPKKFSRSKALGFCGGVPVGMAETARAQVAACWWPDGAAKLLELEGFKDLRVLFARNDTIPGSWSKSSGEKVGAAAWHLDEGTLVGTNLHDTRFERTWAQSAGGGLIVGSGVHKGSLGARPRDSGLVWDGSSAPREITADHDVQLRATDGVRFAGSIGPHASFWSQFGATAINLSPEGTMTSEAWALDGELHSRFDASNAEGAHTVKASTQQSIPPRPRSSGFSSCRSQVVPRVSRAGVTRPESTSERAKRVCSAYLSIEHPSVEQRVPTSMGASTQVGKSR